MQGAIFYTFLSVIGVSLISLVAALPLLVRRTSSRVMLILLSGSVGVLLGTVMLDFLPEAMEHGTTFQTGLFVLLGFIVVFLVESVVHWNHSHKKSPHGHGHAYSLAPVNVFGDAIHNFLDGLVIAGAYSVSIVLGWTATISVIFHEVPQELADMGVLLYAGLSRKKAILYNLGAALMAIVGAIVGLLLAGKIQGFTGFILPFAAGNFLYIAAANLVPQLQGKKVTDTVVHVIAMIVGFGVVAVISMYGPHPVV